MSMGIRLSCAVGVSTGIRLTLLLSVSWSVKWDAHSSWLWGSSEDSMT